MTKKLTLFTLTILLTSSLFAQVTAPKSLDEWIKIQIQSKVSKLDAKSKQMDPPAALSDASLVDLTSASDIASIALRFAGVHSNDGSANEDAGSMTATLYSILAASTGNDPLDPTYYQAHPAARRFIVTLGETDEKDEAGTDFKVRLYQLKTILRPRSLPTNDDVQGAMKDDALDAFAKVSNAVRVAILTDPRVRREYISPKYREFLLDQNAQLKNTDIDKRTESLFSRQLTEKGLLKDAEKTENTFWDGSPSEGIEGVYTKVANDISTILPLLTPGTKKEMQHKIENYIDPFVAQASKLQDLVQSRLRSPQFAVAVSTKDPQRDNSMKTFIAEALYDQGWGPRTSFALNARYSRPEGAQDEDDTLTVGGMWRIQLASAHATKNASFVDISGEASLLDERTYKGQVKWTLPLTAGIQIPVSITVANRDDLVKETNVVGHIGVSFDFSKVAEAFKRE